MRFGAVCRDPETTQKQSREKKLALISSLIDSNRFLLMFLKFYLNFVEILSTFKRLSRAHPSNPIEGSKLDKDLDDYPFYLILT